LPLSYREGGVPNGFTARVLARKMLYTVNARGDIVRSLIDAPKPAAATPALAQTNRRGA
jgi:hypothetical protein